MAVGCRSGRGRHCRYRDGSSQPVALVSPRHGVSQRHAAPRQTLFTASGTSNPATWVRRAFSFLTLALLLTAAPVFAQPTTDTDPSEAARFRVGVLRFTPSLAISNVGRDNNVFNEAEDPKSDTTAAFGPAVDYWLRMGRARLAAKSSLQYLYFKTYEEQRSWNTTNQGELSFSLNRLRPFVGGTYTNTRERPGYEIDARARRRDNTLRAGFDLRVSPKTTFVFSGAQSQAFYDRDETFLGRSLADALDRTSTNGQLQFRYALTPLTTLVVTGDAIQDRFEVSGERNADSIRVMPGFEFKPFALISGRVGIGVRRFTVVNGGIPDYQGLVAATDASYAAGATRLNVKWDRDVMFSYEALQPYYTLNDVSLTLTERITQSWDVVARGGWQRLAYRNSSAATNLPERVDHGATYGAGLGYRLGETARIGFDANYYTRDSVASDIRNYEGLRIGASVTFGLPQ